MWAEEHSSGQSRKGHHALAIVGKVPAWAKSLETASIVVSDDPENFHRNDIEIPFEGAANPPAPMFLSENRPT